MQAYYGLNVMILEFCIGGSKAAVHTGDVGSNPTLSKKISDINQLMGYRDDH